MSPTAGIVFAAALLIGIAGVAKITRPAATQVALRTAGLPSSRIAAQLLGAAELVIVAVALALAGTVGAVIEKICEELIALTKVRVEEITAPPPAAPTPPATPPEQKTA